MNFSNAREVDSLCWQMLTADYPRSYNRSLINNLLNGFPPYPDDEEREINCNFLEGTVVAHDARSQFYSHVMKAGNYFRCSLDMGAKHKRKEYSTIVTSEVNRIMKRSQKRYECLRSKFALDVAHGIGPSSFLNSDCWCPDPLGIEDVLVPGNSLLTMNDLPFIVLRRSFTFPQLKRLTGGRNVDPGWNIPLVNDCLAWIDSETATLMTNNYNDIWSPEKQAERIKSDGGWFAGDNVPVVNTFDFYFWNDEGRRSGWNRRILLDAWSSPDPGAIGAYSVKRPGNGKYTRKNDGIWGKKDDDKYGGFLYNPGNKRKWGSKLSEIINFQFADLSAVAPFRYHSVRSLGYLMYNVCHLQNRMRCSFNESVFEAMMMYFRVNTMEDAQRVLKVELKNRGFVDRNVEFVKAQDRYQINAPLVELGLQENMNIISRNSSSYTSSPSRSPDKRDVTATQWIGESQKATQLVSAALLQADQYQKFEDIEIFRRFCKKDSQDIDVRKFRASVLRQGVPEELLNSDSWQVDPERPMGSGNKQLEMAIAEWLMQHRREYDPDAQRQILRDATLAITDDAARSEMLVPEQPQISDSVHDAQLSIGTLLLGQPMAFKQGINHEEYAQTLITALAVEIGKITSSGGVAGPKILAGLQNLAGQSIQGEPLAGNGADNHIRFLAQDDTAKSLVKQLSDQLGKLMNLLKAAGQRWQEQQEAKASQNGQNGDPELAASLKADMVKATTNSEIKKADAARKMGEKQVSFERKMEQGERQHQQKMRQDADKAILELQTDAARAAIDLSKQAAQAEESDTPPE